MMECQSKIVNKLGLHARAAAKLVKLSSNFESTIEIEKEGKRVSCKSIMGVMMLAAGCGSEVTLYIDGVDEKAAMDAMLELIRDRFGEDK